MPFGCHAGVYSVGFYFEVENPGVPLALFLFNLRRRSQVFTFHLINHYKQRSNVFQSVRLLINKVSLHSDSAFRDSLTNALRFPWLLCSSVA